MPEPDPLLIVRDAISDDMHSITEIYNHYIENTVVTFEEEPVTVSQMQKRVEEVQEAGLPWLVAYRDEQVFGYAYVGNWKARSAYRHSVETSVYVDPNASGRGVGHSLFEALDERLHELPIRFAAGVIALPNEASVQLHEKFGYEKAGLVKDVGYKFGQWVDCGYWQKVFPFEPPADTAEDGETTE